MRIACSSCVTHSAPCSQDNFNYTSYWVGIQASPIPQVRALANWQTALAFSGSLVSTSRMRLHTFAASNMLNAVGREACTAIIGLPIIPPHPEEGLHVATVCMIRHVQHNTLKPAWSFLVLYRRSPLTVIPFLFNAAGAEAYSGECIFNSYQKQQPWQRLLSCAHARCDLLPCLQRCFGTCVRALCVPCFTQVQHDSH